MEVVIKRDKLRNVDINNELNVISDLDFLERAQLLWFGYVMWMEEDRALKCWLN